jgi:predicted nucleotidyltransferase
LCSAGEPAIFDRAVRAAAAVDCGANLVLELPVTCALRSAEGFASGAAEL